MIEDARLDSREVGVLKELPLLQAALAKPLEFRAHHYSALTGAHILTSLSVSLSRIRRPLGLAVRGVLVREVEERVAWHGTGLLGRRTGRGTRILGVTSFSFHNPILWKSFTTVRQYLDTCHQLYDMTR